MKITDTRSLVEVLRQQGYTVEKARNGYWQVTAPDGRKCQIGATPSDGRSVKNAITHLKRRVGFRPPKK